MAEIGPLSQPLPPSHSSSIANVPVLSKQMQEQVLLLAEHLQKIKEDPSLALQSSFLNEFASNGAHLNQTIEQAIVLR